MLDPLITHAIGLGMSVLFLSAAWHKLSDIRRFETALRNYELLPAGCVAAAARLLPLMETILGIAWLLSLSINIIAPASAGLLGIYTFAIAINVLRGRVHIDCGCGRPGADADEQPLTAWLVLRNAVLITFALVPVLPVTERAFSVLDYVAVSAAVIVALLLYSTATQLLRNASVIRSWRDSRG